MSNVLSTLIAAVFVVGTIASQAAEIPATDPGEAAKVEAGEPPARGATAERISKSVTVPKQTQGATFGEKVNQGLHAAAGALSQGASLLGGALPGGAVISAAATTGEAGNSDPGTGETAAVSSVGNLAGGAGGGAAADSYAATGMVSAPPAGSVVAVHSMDDDTKVDASKAKAKSTKPPTKHAAGKTH